ncbi:MAG: internalization-related competence protein ComEC/Rec2, partial [Nocardioides sp.]|nr:internalization-related competence protein ComEC/Rec2 [Nocardioides sp.]
LGGVTLQVLWPPPDRTQVGAGDGSRANDASVVLLVEVRGVRLLLTGDLEPEGQAALAGTLAGLDVDVLKVPHHGSRYQDLDFLTSLDAEVALVSVGADNDYGHPADVVVDALAADGSEVRRTDTDGDVLVVTDGDGVSTVTR